jgi:hypothetical protein
MRPVLSAFALSRHRRERSDVSLLAIHAPIAQFVKGDSLSSHGAAHVTARPQDAKIAIKKFNLRLASVDWSTLESVHLKDPDLAVLCHDGHDKGTSTLPWIR